MRLEPQALEPCLQFLREQLADLQAVYLFGSEATGQAGSDSDVDLAVLLPASLPAVRRWLLMEYLAEQLGRDVGGSAHGEHRHAPSGSDPGAAFMERWYGC